MVGNEKLLEYTVEIAKAAVSEAGDKATYIVNNPDGLTAFIDAVYKKLAEINKG